jgi:hypothetical protein
MNQYEKLLLQNKEWSEEIREKDPDYFKRLAPSQSPNFLFIGCALIAVYRQQKLQARTPVICSCTATLPIWWCIQILIC